MITACLITKNEDINLTRCLSSIEGKVDEIILVDTGSIDDTINIANDFGCRVFHHNWNDDFSEVRNFAINQACGEYIFIIDADEELSPESDLRNLIKCSNQDSVFLINVLSISNIKNGQQVNFNSKQARLFKNSPIVKFEGRVHEQVLNKAISAGLKIVNSDLKILHHGYNINENQLMLKHSRNLNLITKELLHNHNNEYYLVHKASTLNALNRKDEALKILTDFVSSSSNCALKVKAYNLIGEKYYNSNELDNSFKYFNLSINENSKQIYPNLKLADLAYKKNDLIKSLEHLLLIDKIKNSEQNDTLYDIEISESEITFKIAKLYILMEKFVDSIKYLQSKPEMILKETNLAVLYSNALFHSDRLHQSYKVLENIINRGEVNLFVQSLYNKVKRIVENFNFPQISLCMIVKDEEYYLDGCLDSVIGVVDEIIIVDTGSSDNTVKIAEKYNAKIYYYQWVDDFSKARNESLKHAKGKWILYLDADERLVDLNAYKIKSILDSLDDEVSGLNCVIESEVTKKNGSTELQRGAYPRLFRNLTYPFVRFEGKIHEQVLNSLIEMGGHVINSDFKIKHLGYNASIETLELKSNRNYKLLKEQIDLNPEDSYSWFQLANTLLQQGKISEAEQPLMKAINLGNLSSVILASAYNSLSQIYGNKRHFFKAIEYADMSLELFSNQQLAYILKAEAQRFLGLKKQALDTIDKLLLTKSQLGFLPEIGFDVDYNIEEINRFKSKIILS